uniref:CRAL-TRIO domain-containing protein n=1 Tax=Globodera pallida TaxID=36090 RepID=A0A183BK66_GLOPA
MPKPNSSVGRIKHLLDTGNGADVHFLFADVNHTRDEWTQASLTGLINPESAGFSLPRTLEEFKEGLANAAMDILPDFAFAVPVAMFVANPPAAMLWAGWIAVGEYFAKKSWSLVLRDVVLPTEQGERFKKMLEENKLPAKRVFKKEEDAGGDGGDGTEKDKEMALGADNKEPVDGVEEAEESKGKQVSIKDAIADSQVDSNLYQYLFMNTLRAYFVIGTSIYSYFAKEIVNAKDEQMTALALEMKHKINKNEKDSKLKQKKDQKKLSEWVEKVERVNDVITAELQETERKDFQVLAKEIAHRIIYKKPAPVEGSSDLGVSLQTTADLISEMSSSPAVLEEMVKVKLGNRTKPKGMQSNDEKREKHFPTFVLAKPELVANNANIQFLPIFNEIEMNELNVLFKEKVNNVIKQINAVNQFKEAGEQRQNEKREKSQRELVLFKETVVTTTKQVNVAAKKLSEAGSSNRQRQQNVVTQGASPKGVNPLLKRGGSKGLGEVLL